MKSAVHTLSRAVSSASELNGEDNPAITSGDGGGGGDGRRKIAFADERSRGITLQRFYDLPEVT